MDMKVALIRSAVHRRGGVERYVWMLARELARRGHEVHIIARRMPELPHPAVRFKKVSTIGLFSFLKVLSFASHVKKIIRREPFDITHSCDRVFSCDIYRAGEGVHREWLEVSSRHMPKWQGIFKRMDPLHFLLLRIEARLMNEKNSRRVTAISRRGAEEIYRHFGRENVPVIYNGVDPDEFRPPGEGEKKNARLELGLPDDAFAILFLGSGFFRKGLRFLIEGFSRLSVTEKKLILLVAGSGNTGPYKRLARSLGVDRNILFLGSGIPAFRLYHAADLFVFPTLYEPFGNVCLEAMASGLPCIFSSKSGGAEIVEDQVSGLILKEPTNVEEIARLIQVCLNGEKAAKMGREARAVALKFSVAANTDLTERIYREIIDEKRGENCNAKVTGSG